MSTISIRLAGVDVTDYVVFADAQFTQQTNGQPGGARIRLKDLAHVLAPHAGQTLTLDIDGDRVWGGWAISVSPGYFFPVDDTTNSATTERVWLIEALDYNVLFIKRFLINKANPTKMIPNYPAGTPDSEIVLDIAANYVVLSGDGISTAGVTHVGTPNPDKAGNVGNPGTAWGACMSLIARPNQAVFFIDPGKVLRYVDVETETAPFGLSDTPNHSSTFGYRDVEIVKDGTKLINDALVWGAGQGKASVTFKRAEDTSSITEHGRWQFGEFTTALYTDAGVNHRAQSYVYGSPQSKRGGKDDSIQVACTIYEPGLIAGQVVSFFSDVFNYSDTLPIRRMGIKFPTTTDVEYRLYLSYDIDAPWSDYEFWFPKFNFPIPNFDINITIPDPQWPPPPPTEHGCDCGITDTFSRSIPGGVNDPAGNWGTCDAGIPIATFEDTGYFWVEDGVGKVAVQDDPAANNYAYHEMPVPRPPDDNVSLTLKFLIETPTFDPSVDVSDSYLGLFFLTAGQEVIPPFTVYRSAMQAWVDFPLSDPDPDFSEPAFLNINVVYGPYDGRVGSRVEMPSFAYDTWYEMSYEQVFGGTASVTVWPSGGVPADGWTTSVDISTQPDASIIEYGTGGWYFSQDFELGPSGEVGYIIAQYDDIDLPWVTRCAGVFDEFNRSETNGWGVSDSGTAWVVTSSPASVFSANGQAAAITASSGAPAIQISSDVLSRDAWTMTSRFATGSLGAGVRSIRHRFIGPDINRSVWLNLSKTAGTLELDAASPASTSFNFADATRYQIAVSWNVTTGEAKMKVWKIGDAEPDWMLEALWGPGSGPIATLEISQAFMSALYSHQIDSIDFDYDGKGCYDCGSEATPTYVDTFTRTEPFMGTSDTGQSWSIFRNGQSPTSTVETTGTTGRVLVPHPVVFDVQADDTAIELGGTYIPGHVIVSFKLKINSADMNITDLTPFIDISYGGVDWNLEFGGAVFGGVGGARNHGQRLQIISFAPTGATSDEIFGYVLTTGVWYQTKLENNPGAVTRLKIWPVTDPEPAGWTLSVSAVGQSAFASDFDLYCEQGGSLSGDLSENLEVEIDDLQIGLAVASTGCGEVPGVSQPPTQGTTCESFDSGASLLVTSAPYQPLTTRVYVGGLLQRVNTDYTEQSPAEGKVLLGSPPPSGSTVTVCYVANIA